MQTIKENLSITGLTNSTEKIIKINMAWRHRMCLWMLESEKRGAGEYKQVIWRIEEWLLHASSLYSTFIFIFTIIPLVSFIILDCTFFVIKSWGGLKVIDVQRSDNLYLWKCGLVIFWLVMLHLAKYLYVHF